MLGTHLAVLRGEVERLSRVMRDLIEFGRPVSGERVDAALGDVVREAVTICRSQAERAGVTLREELGDATFVLAMRRERLLQVFRNVVENAIQHSPSGGTVRIALTRHDAATGPVVECVVSDTGDGIAPEDVPHLFDPFFSRRKGGTGLGLAIVQRIVEEHHGTVTAGNGVVRGAEFTIRLPLAAAEPGWEVAS
jgi:signal transduction histidine kinase